MRDQEPGGLRRWSRSAVLTVAIVTAVATAAIAALLVNIIERKGEAQQTFFRVVELTDETIDPAVWGKNFPQQYHAYLRTVDQQRTRYGGSEAMPRSPTEPDPALDGVGVAPGRRRSAEDDVGGLRVRHGFSQEARPRVHARGPDFH